MTKRFIVTAVDHDINGNCDGKARVLGVHYVREAAKDHVDEEIREWIDNHAPGEFMCDFAKMSAWYIYDEAYRCEWNIEEVELD